MVELLPSLVQTMPSLVLSVVVAGVCLFEIHTSIEPLFILVSYWETWRVEFTESAHATGISPLSKDGRARLGTIHKSLLNQSGEMKVEFGVLRWRLLSCLALPLSLICWALALKALSGASRCGGWMPRTKQVVQDRS